MAAALIARETTLRNDVFRVFRMADIRDLLAVSEKAKSHVALDVAPC
jgi:hypothetical protein